jgi:phage terminase large subunit
MVIDLTNISKITNNKFMPEYESRDRHLVLHGGGDSGKSHFAATKIICRCLVAEANGFQHKFLVTRKTQPAVRKSAFALVKEKLKLFNLPKSAVKIHETMMEISIFRSKIIFVGLDDPEKIKSIEGITGTWQEEPTELKPDDSRQLDLRMRGFIDDYMQHIYTFNPIDVNNWLNSEFFTGLDNEGKPRPDFFDVTPKDWPSHKTRKEFRTKVVHSTYQDNRWTTPAGIATLEGLKHKDPNFYKVYCLGQWGVLKGLIYEHWKQTELWPAKFDIRGYGLDFGFTNHPSAWIEAGIIGNDLFLRERFYEKGLTNADIADIMNDQLKEGDSSPTIADCAEPKSIAELKRAGMYVLPCKKGKDSIVHGIQKVKQFNIYVHADSVNLIKELRAYKWGVDKNDKATNKPVDYLNHALDAMRYVVEYLTNFVKINIDYDNDPKEERKAELQSEDYNPITDDSIWNDVE